MEFLKKLGQSIRSAVTRPGPARTVLVILAILAVSIGLAVLNLWLGLDQFVAAPYAPLRRFWLPLLFLLVCLNAWLIRRLWRLWVSDHDSSEFAEIDRAWREARLAMRRAGVELGELPVFLVLGDPVGGVTSLFHASGMPLAVSDIPRRADAPIHVFATYEAIFVTCPGLSALGHLARSRAAHVDVAASPPSTPASAIGLASDVAPAGRTAEAAVATTVDVATEPARAATGGQPAPRERSLEILLSQTAEVEAIARRFKYLCKLLLRDRQPYCPINGILLLLPFSATDSESEARQAGTACHLDLTLVREALLVDCPVFALMCDLETAPHFDRFLSDFSEEQRSQLMGRTFPLVFDLPVAERIQKVEAGGDWIGHAFLVPLFYRVLRFGATGDAVRDDMRENTRLFRFFADMHGRARRLGRLLGRLIALDQRGQVMLGGCFVAGTGRDPARAGLRRRRAPAPHRRPELRLLDDGGHPPRGELPPPRDPGKPRRGGAGRPGRGRPVRVLQGLNPGRRPAHDWLATANRANSSAIWPPSYETTICRSPCSRSRLRISDSRNRIASVCVSWTSRQAWSARVTSK